MVVWYRLERIFVQISYGIFRLDIWHAPSARASTTVKRCFDRSIACYFAMIFDYFCVRTVSVRVVPAASFVVNCKVL